MTEALRSSPITEDSTLLWLRPTACRLVYNLSPLSDLLPSYLQGMLPKECLMTGYSRRLSHVLSQRLYQVHAACITVCT